MQAVVTYKSGDGLYSAATTMGLLCYNAPRAAAVAAIVAIGLSAAEANSALDAPADAPTWRATWTAAVSSQLADIEADISSLVDSDRATILETKLASAMEMLAEIHAQQTEANRLAADANKLAADKLDYQRKRDAMIAEQHHQREQQRLAAEFQRKWAGVRVGRYEDGTIEVTRQERPGIQTVLQRFKPGDAVPPEILARVR